MEITLDYDGFLDLCQREGVPVKATLEKFKSLGVTSVAPSETTLERLHESGLLVWVQGADAEFLQNHGIEPLFLHRLRANFPYLVLFVPDKALYAWLNRAFSSLLNKNQFQPFPGGFIVYGKRDDLLQLGLGIFPGQIEPASSLGLPVNPRVSNRDDININRLNYILENSASLPNVSTLIFSGLRNEVLGYEHHVPLVAKFLKEHSIYFGFVEAYEASRAVKGAEELARKIPDLVVKVQALVLPQYGRIDPEKGAGTFLLGVRERNIRIVYYRPFLINYGGNSLLDTNFGFLKSMRKSLTKSGYVLEKAAPFPGIRGTGSIGSFILGSGILAGCFLLLLMFSEVPVILLLGTAVGFALLFVAAGLFGGASYLRFGLAFLGANVFTVLGVVLFLSREPLGYPRSVVALAKGTLITLSGGLIISALLMGNLTLLGIETFRGVKSLFVLPVLFSPWIAWLCHVKRIRFRNLLEALAGFFEPLKRSLRLDYAVALLAFMLIGGFILLRSGNAVPEGAVPDWEKMFRTFLGNVLVARPRFKEFLIGHPFFILAASLGLGKKWTLLFLVFGAIGQADIMDSMAHLHTPLYISLIRTLNGLWIGILLGGVFQFVLNKVGRRCAPGKPS